MSSALLLERHFFTKLELNPNPDGKPEGKINVVCAAAIGNASDDPARYQITLAVTISPDPKAPAKPYYSGVVEIVGFFRVAPSYKDDPVRLVNISGSSILYGAVRELFCNLTARGPWPMVTLPTMNFTPQATESGQVKKKASPQTALPAAAPAVSQ
jgi:preprotein translocase subunit SecB